MSKKPLLTIWDIDKTLYDGYCIIDFGIYLAEIGYFKPGFINRITNIKDRYQAGKINYETFAADVYRIYGDFIFDKNLYEVLQLSKQFWSKNFNKLYPAALSLHQRLTAAGSEHAAISGSSFESLYYLLDRLGFVKMKTTEYETIEGNFTKKIVSTLVSHYDKSKLNQRVLNQKNKYEKVIGIGDNLADRAFLEHVDIAIVMGNNPELQAVAKTRNWIIITDPLEQDINSYWDTVKQAL